MGNPKSEKDRLTKDGKILVSPREYELKPNESKFTFKNFYIEYGRFHADEMNTIIHVIFIPFIVITIYGLVYKSEMLGNIIIDTSKEGALPIPKLGRYDGPPSDKVLVFDTVLIVWGLFCFVYSICDPVIGATCFVFFNICF